MNEIKGQLGYKGEPGLSAYEIAVKEGYEGTEEEWIAHFGLDLSSYLQTSDVVNNLTSTYTTRPLSANQGKEIKNLNTSLEHTYTLKKDYTQNDLDYIYAKFMAEPHNYTEEDYNYYDFDEDGEIEASDISILTRLIGNNCAKGVTSPAKLKLEAGNYPHQSKMGLYDCDGNLISKDYKLKNEFTVLQGTMTVNNNHEASKNIDYPTGFTKDNSVITGAVFNSTILTANYLIPHYFSDSTTGAITGSVNCIMNGDDINIYANGTVFQADEVITYKIVLMKVA